MSEYRNFYVTPNYNSKRKTNTGSVWKIRRKSNMKNQMVDCFPPGYIFINYTLWEKTWQYISATQENHIFKQFIKRNFI